MDAREATFDLFSEDHLHRMVHYAGPSTEIEAARAVSRRRSSLHAQVLQAFRDLGDMTDEQLERLPQFEHCAPSTIRKRRSELTAPEYFDPPPVVSRGKVERPGRTPMTLWGLRA